MPNVRARRNEGFYFVVVDGVPQYCQWQELKDYLRDSAKVRPGHTNVVKVNEDGTRVGFCPLPNKTEANRAFEYLVAEGWRGLDIRVSLVWKPDLGSNDIERRRGPEQSRRRRLPATTTILPFPNNVARPPRILALPLTCDTIAMSQGLHAPPYSTSDFQRLTISEMSRYSQYPIHNGRHISQCTSTPLINQKHLEKAGRHKYNNSWSPFPEFQPRNPIPVSMTRYHDPSPTPVTNQKCIHISRLPYDVKYEELTAFLRRCGLIAALSVSRTQQLRCSATARFGTAAEASLAVRELDGQCLRNRKLAVQYSRGEADSNVDSDPSSVSKGSDSDSSGGQGSSDPPDERSGPLIVNGARGPGYHRKKRRDDDSESLDDAGSADEGRECKSQGSPPQPSLRRTKSR